MALRTHLLSFLLLSTLSITAQVSANEKATYTNKTYNFAFDYPSTFHLKKFGDGFFDLFNNGKIVLRGSIEDNSFKIFIKENKPTAEIFRSFARERCKIVCGADGPDGSTYCDEIESEREYISANGLPVLEFYMVMTRENYLDKTKKKSGIGPVYVVDMSKEDRHLALMIYSGYGALASESAKSLAQGVIDSVRLLL